MKTTRDFPFWGDKYSPLASLAGVVLLIGATSRVSYALIISAAIFFVYAISTFFLRVSSRFIPSAHRTWIRIVFVSTVTAIFCRIAGIAWPVPVKELAPYFGMVPLSLIASDLLDRTAEETPMRTIQASVYEAFILCGIALVLAAVREAFGYGTLSIPNADGITVLITQESAAALSLRSLTATAGGFILFGYLLAAYRKNRFRRYGIPRCGEDDV
ncbi:MAG: Rnf-Nqr domain containing protein [Treponemataceae bacterium]